MTGKCIIFSAPSGAGKTTIVKHLLQQFPQLTFSISATSRKVRGEEVHGKDYYFLSPEEFATKTANDEFVEWEEVYKGTSYGTLKSEVERIWSAGNVVVFDVDVVGGVNLKKYFGKAALSVFIQPPSVAILRERLEGRGTDSASEIDKRIAKAAEELAYAPQFDAILVNDGMDVAFTDSERLIGNFLA